MVRRLRLLSGSMGAYCRHLRLVVAHVHLKWLPTSWGDFYYTGLSGGSAGQIRYALITFLVVDGDPSPRLLQVCIVHQSHKARPPS